MPITITGGVQMSVGTNMLPAPSLTQDFTTGTLDPRITFSRTSLAMMTGSNGLIQYAPHNLLTYSEQFNNAAWTKQLVSVTSNVTASPDSSVTADKLIMDATSTWHGVSSVINFVAGVTYTFSAYAKASEYNFIGLVVSGNQARRCFNLSTGAVGTSAGIANTATITSAGNGWYRVTMTFTSTSTAGNGCYLVVMQGDADPVTPYVGNGTSGIFIWGAQLEIGSAATTYNSTTVKNLLGYTQEFDNAGWAKTNVYVQTNLLTYSEQFDNAAWTKLNSFIQTNLLTYSEQFDVSAAWGSSSTTRTANTTIAPNGTLSADTITATNVLYGCLVRTSATYAASTTYTLSVYAKAGTATRVGLRVSGSCASSGDVYPWFDLSTGTFTTVTPQGGTIVSGNAVNVGSGWWRLSVVYTTPSTAPAGTTDFAIVTATGGTAYTPAGTETIYLWGAQLVQGTTPGDYQATGASTAAIQYTGPFGVLNAEKLVETTADGGHYVEQSVTGGASSTGSYYVKAGERTKCEAYLIDSVGIVAGTASIFNLANGTVESGTGSITAVGNGWYRISTTATLTAGAQRYRLLTYTTADTYTGDGTSGIYVYGAQLVQGSSAGDYQITTTAAAAVQYTGPFGYLGADKLVEDASNNLHRIVQASTVVSGGIYVFSAYLKAGERTTAGLAVFDGSTFIGRSNFDLTGVGTATIVSGTAGISSLGNGWYRCWVSGTSAAASVNSYINVNSVYSYQGDGTSGIYVFGAQLSDSASLDPYVYNVGAVPSAAAYYGPRFDWSSTARLAQVNFMLSTEDLETGVFNYRLNITTASNVVAAPDGTNADKLIETTASGLHYIGTSFSLVSTINSTYTLSVYLQKAGRNWVQLFFANQTNCLAWFNLDTGVVGTKGTGNLGATIEAVGGGWYRCSIVGQITRANPYPTIALGTADGTSSYTGDGTSGVYVWGWQLELGSSATTYQAVGAQLPTNTPLVATTGTSNGLLIEEARTNRLLWSRDGTSNGDANNENRITYSQTFSNAVWTLNNASLGSTTITAPDSSSTAASLIEASGTVSPYIRQTAIEVGANNNVCISAYIKALPGSAARYVYIGGVYTTATTRWGYALFNPVTGAFINTFFDNIQDTTFSATTTDVGNGWFRVSVIFNSPLASQRFQIGLTNTTTPTNANTLGSYTGDGTSGVYIWGAQINTGNFLGPYQVTTTAAITTPWIKSSVTVAKNQTGIDGVANTATTVTASASNAVLIQSVSLASGSRTCSVYLKRITGTGTIQVTLDGSTWSTVDLVTTQWRRIVLSGTVTNPCVGIKISTNGDSIAMDYGQVEDGAFATTPIFTTTATVTRNADNASMQGTNFTQWFNQYQGTLYVEGITGSRTVTAANADFIAGLGSNLALVRGASSLSLGWFIGTTTFQSFNFTTANRPFKTAASYFPGNNAALLNGGSTVIDSGSTYSLNTAFYIGQNASNNLQMNGWIRSISYYQYRLSNTDDQYLTRN